jgi:hypothetical protein
MTAFDRGCVKTRPGENLAQLPTEQSRWRGDALPEFGRRKRLRANYCAETPASRVFRQPRPIADVLRVL